MSNSPRLETYRLFYEHIPIPKPAANLPTGRQGKPARKRKQVVLGRSLLETPTK